MVILLAENKDKLNIEKYDSHISSERLGECIWNRQVYVLKDDSNENTVVGVLRYSLFWQTIPFLDLIYIDESYRGKSCGTAMMNHWESEMRQRGYKYVMTSTQSDENAYLFYEKLGYRKVGSFLPPEQAADEWMYLKALE